MITSETSSPKPSNNRQPSESRAILLFVILLLLLAGVAFIAWRSKPFHLPKFTSNITSPQPGFYRVTETSDGDTIRVDMNGTEETIRMIGVDTPETHHPEKPVQCFGQAASDFTKNLLQNASVRLESDPQSTNRDRYNRLLRYVYTESGELVNKKLISDGYGFAYTSFPFDKLEEFRAAEREAREQNRGLWAGCNVDESGSVPQTQNRN